MKTKLLLLGCLSAICILFSFRWLPALPPDFLDILQQKLTLYNDQLPAEKVYIHTDKTFYKPGESIWLKAYVSKNLQGTTVSDLVYVDLLNPRGNVEHTLTLFVKEGGATGDFTLDESVPGGLYKIRAYTHWMKNFQEEFIFEKEIQVQKVLTPKLLLKLDFTRKAYGAGDTVAADVEVQTLENKPLAHHPVAYQVQIAGKPLLQAQAATQPDGMVRIRFALPHDLTTTDGLLNVTIAHEGKNESISRSIPIVLNKIAVQFFPEGGDWIAGVPTKLAFKALNEYGKPADIEGFVADEAGKPLQSFKSYHQGMGAFMLTASAHRSYKVKITRPAIDQWYELPATLSKGYALAVDTVLRERIHVSFYSPVEKTVYLVAQVGGVMYFSKEIQAKDGKNTLTIPTKNFPVGIARLTLFDYLQVPRCERLAFVNPHKQLHVQVTTDKTHYTPREKVQLTVRTLDEDSLPVPAHLSVSVADDQLLTFADDKQDNILSGLLMSSELKGKIEEPSFYFKPNESKAALALDYVLMTHGWRHFAWKEVLDKPRNPAFLAEKAGSLSGMVVDAKTGKPIAATVHLFEFSEKRRSAQLKTSANGRFVFQQTDPRSPIQLFAQAAGTKREDIAIQLDHATSLLAGLQTARPASSTYNAFAWQDAVSKATVKQNLSVVQDEATLDDDFAETNSMQLKDDQTALSEVVVVGYGEQRKSSLTGAISQIRSADWNPGLNPLEQSLQGRAAGIMVIQDGGAPGASASLRVRGYSSLIGSEPLYVINGIPSSSADFVAADDIESITITKSGEATALYGSQAMNGVVTITTKHKQLYRSSLSRPRKSISQTYVPARQFSVVRQFYTPAYTDTKPVEQRTDFRSTVYWNPDVQTDARTGTATVSFYNSDQVTAFRITAEGMGSTGQVGRTEQTYFTQLPFSLEARIPPYLTFGDEADIPLLLKNNTTQPITGTLEIELPNQLKIKTFNAFVNSLPGEAKTIYLPVEVQNIAGKGSLQLTFQSSGFRESVRQEIEVQPKGFPTEAAFSARERDKRFSFSINDPVKGSLRAELKVYPNILSDLMGGVESVFREPYGCFEQTSSSTYPNVLALQYLRESGLVNPTVEKKALEYIAKGYKRLIGFETKEGGFEWFGGTPPHEALTAFGIAEFTEMKKVYDKVDETMLKRTQRWILSRRDGKGGFKRDSRQMHYITGSEEVIEAYIVYALSEAGMKEIRPEYEASFRKAQKSQNLYQMSLLANASLNFGEVKNGLSLIQDCVTQLREKGWKNANLTTSMTCSYGQSLQTETTALLLQAVLKTGQPDYTTVQSLVNQLIATRSYGGFGSTQATILALKALTEYARFARRTSESGNVLVYLGDKQVGAAHYEKDAQGELTIDGIERYMQAGTQPFRVVFADTKEPLPYSLNVSWSAHTPQSSAECNVNLKTHLADREIAVGKTVRLSTVLENKTNHLLPMTVALVGIPSGLSPQPWQLKELQEKKGIDFYEVRKNYVVFYYRQLMPQATHTIHLDLKADIPGHYQAPASTAYLYYTNEFKDWEAGATVQVTKE